LMFPVIFAVFRASRHCYFKSSNAVHTVSVLSTIIMDTVALHGYTAA